MHDPQLEYELTWCEVEQEAEVWGRVKARKERSAGLDGALNAMFELHNKRMDFLLEDLLSKMGALGVSGGSVAGAA